MTASQRKFLVVSDDTPEFQAALKFACRRARSTGGHVAILRVIEPAVFEHWSGVREEIERQTRDEAEAVLQEVAGFVQDETGFPPEFLIVNADSPRAGLKKVISEDPAIKILVLAAAVGGRGPGPLVASLAKDGVKGAPGRSPSPSSPATSPTTRSSIWREVTIIPPLQGRDCHRTSPGPHLAHVHTDRADPEPRGPEVPARPRGHG
ncbi:universal stress protein [Phenylobacterium sp. J367]|uniref:universal stress protein n=1 Tax=Phenylobacterium sp. J367 TaxID=2898435 RepID=UPI002151F53E|nr:universal stress protein [Phenylobacterium sp. J367]MCR5878042.1 universal stress protein [Phenylobacterium sp. J367]